MVKNLPASTGDAGLIRGLRRAPGEGGGSPLQCSCQESPLDRGAWRAAVGHGESDTTQRLSNYSFTSLLRGSFSFH